MKSEIRIALLALAATSAPAFAQDNTPQCAALFDSSQNMFTSKNAPASAVNQQCFLTVLPKNGPASDPNFPRLAQYPNPQIGEGTYEILLSGGGGGGGAGLFLGSGGGGAGAVPVKTSQYLTPGVYKLTIGTSGAGGTTGISGGRGQAGNPTSITKAYTNETIAGFAGADTWSGTGSRGDAGNAGSGGDAGNAGGAGAHGVAGQGSGGDGGRLPNREGRGEKASHDGGSMNVAGIATGAPGKGGAHDGGGGGGAGYGKGGDARSAAMSGGDRSGSEGGDGFVILRPIQLALATPAQATPAAAWVDTSARPKTAVAPARAPKNDRN